MKGKPMNRFGLWAMLLGAVAAERGTCAAETAAEPVPAVECRARGGLPNFFAKLQAGGEVRIAYLGGSITAAPGWRPKSLAWFQSQFPAAKLSEINAAIGGTGSDLGVFRVGQDVLRHKPDLVFVEFAVNDSGAPVEQIHRCMEGIVRQTLKADPKTDLCFVYTVSEPLLADLQQGRFPRAAAAMEAVADRYGIPSIHLGLDVARRVADGRLVFKAAKPKDFSAAPMVFSEDGVHPFAETGHELYVQCIARSVPAIRAAGRPGPHAMPEPLRADHWEQAKMIPLSQAVLRGAWEKLDPEKDGRARSFAKQMPVMWRASTPGAAISFKFRGSEAAIYDLLGPDGGRVGIRVDDGPERTTARFDGYCTYHRLGKTVVASGLPPGEHSVTATLLADPPDRARILFEKNRPDLEKNPDKYKGTVWHAGALLLLGELVGEEGGEVNSKQ